MLKEVKKWISNNPLVLILTGISVLLIVFSFFAPMQLTKTAKEQDLQFNNTGQIGDTIGGIMNPFIALAGVFITFLAFYMQYKANELQKNALKESQAEQSILLKEQMFFRIYDNLNQKITALTYIEENIEFSNYKALDNIIDRFRHDIDEECIGLGRRLLASIPDEIPDFQYFKILQTKNPPSSIDASELKKSIIAYPTFEERWEFIKNYIGHPSENTREQNNALRAIGHVQFYRIDFDHRKNIYFNVYYEILNEYRSFIDSYTKNIVYLLNFIDKNHETTFFIDFIKENLSTSELILIFYYCSSGRASNTFLNQIRKYNILENLYLDNNKFVDVPSKEQINNEIDCILTTL